MPCAVNDFELNGRLHLLISTVQLMRLVDWHLRVLISVHQEQRRIVAIDVEDGTGEARQGENIRWLATQQKFQRGKTNLQAVRRELTENRRQVSRAVEADDSLYV